MELEQFISNTLIDIVNGTKKVNEKFTGSASFELSVKDEITFDIAITVTEGGSNSKGGGISVYALKIGAENEKSSLNENISRIKFKIKPSYNIK